MNDSQRQAGALIAEIEHVIARDEREGGKTMRDLAAAILLAVLSGLRDEGFAILDGLFAEAKQVVFR